MIRDGWYVTGDLAILHADGFIQITGRESRFSKIGGEMVPHIKIEETLQRILAAGEEELKVAVTAVPDEAQRRAAGRAAHKNRQIARANLPRASRCRFAEPVDPLAG